MSAPLPFPSAAPFRIDQVTAAPLAMALLFAGQVALAALMQRCADPGRRRAWWLATGGLLALVVLFFALASWGNSDTTKLSHALAHGLKGVGDEPFWALLTPLILALPYRMSLMHGLVAGAYAAMAVLLARHWRCRGWGGWWALLLCCSPLLRGFLQNAQSRQALLALLLVPALLWAGRQAHLSRPGTTLSTLGAATVHTTFLPTLALALLPRALLRDGPIARRLGRWLVLLSTLFTLRLYRYYRGGMGLPPPPPPGRLRRWRLPALALVLLPLAALVAPQVLDKLHTYAREVAYFNTYPLVPAVQNLQIAMAAGAVLVCWRRRLGPLALWRCDRARTLLLFALLYGLVQLVLPLGWYPRS